MTERFAAGKRVRRLLPGEGRLHVDRPLPFLCVRRRAGERASRADRLVMTQASYLLAGGEQAGVEAVGGLVRALAERGAAMHGGFLVLELWETDQENQDSATWGLPPPGFTVAAEPKDSLGSTVRKLERALEQIELEGSAARVFRSNPQALREAGAELVAPEVAQQEGCFWIGLGVAPIYRPTRDRDDDSLYPMVLLELETRLAGAILEAVHEFARSATTLEPDHPHSLGRRALVRSAWNIDRRLVEVSDSFEFLRLSTPVDERQAWQEFSERSFEEPPIFHYPPLPIDPEATKRTLFSLPIERVEDPTLARLFREKQEELDKQINMLRDRGTPAYFYGSLQLYGPVEPELLHVAEQLLSRLPSHERDDEREGYLPAEEMAALAEAAIDVYRARWEEFPKRVELREDIPPGLMVSQDRLLISCHSRIPRARVDALLEHEVGTHLLTYCNGRAQRLHLFHAGLPGYDALQEGLAVLAEHLVGGLSRPRLRLLAARVATCHALTSGATFIESFRQLVDDHGYAPRTAFTVVTRVYRSGGLTKDAVYLRGLTEILEYLGAGGRIEPLFVGKIARRHLDDVEELGRRGVLRQPPLEPNYLQVEAARKRLDRVRRGMNVLDLVEAA
ncbi:MAG TPA: tyrosine/phenylalanine carboxypeptidase domain-containing protein [Thermoanaerobaculia bacterium]|nr:tyrosine/phenylalanine carboxypeptidase domain-containing protein [Thermoanaerobaculia bacterium]